MRAILAIGWIGVSSAFGGGIDSWNGAAVVEDSGKGQGDWCRSLLDSATLYQNSEGSILQKFKLYGLYHHQFVSVNGTDRNGQDFDATYEENRRFWLGVEGEAFRYFKFKVVSNLSRDNRMTGGDWDWGQQNFRSAYVTFDVAKAMGLSGVDGLEVGYGRRSIRMTDQWARSASQINTIERADFSNKMWPSDEDGSNPMAAWVKLKQGRSTFDFALVSSDEDQWIPQWDEGVMYYASWLGDFSSGTSLETNDLWVSAFYQDVDRDRELLTNGSEWAVVGVSRLARDRWALHTSVGLGDNGSQSNGDREGLFWGGYTMPMYWLVDDKLKLVLRYQYEGAEQSEGIRLNRRYARTAETDLALDINEGRGDSHHSIYAGLNWYLCGENAKVVTGVLYDYIESDGERIYDGWTTAIGLRVFF